MNEEIDRSLIVAFNGGTVYKYIYITCIHIINLKVGK